MCPNVVDRVEASPRREASGQILVVFALSLMVLIGMTGLALDGGATFSQRRDQQTAADLAALAGANDYLINNSADLAIARAESIAASNGFTTGVIGTTVSVTVATTNGVAVSVAIGKPHQNSFLAIVGMPIWQVTTTATALAGFPDSAAGASPFIFPISAFSDDGTPKYQTATDFAHGTGQEGAFPVADNTFSWTNFGTGNFTTPGGMDVLYGAPINPTLGYGDYIGQKNNGAHETLLGAVDDTLSGLDLPVAVVDSNGNFMGWAMFHVNSAFKTLSDANINGYFLSSFESARLTVANCADNACPRYLGSYVLKLVD